MSELSRLLKLTLKERKKLVICGVAAALSAVFGAPVAGAVFGVEVLFVGEIFYPVLLPALISGVVAYMVCLRLGVPYYTPVPVIPDLNMSVLAWCVAAAVFFGLVCIFHIEFSNFIAHFFKKLRLPDWEKSLYALILKSFLLSVTLAGGGSGGVLTPTFYIGAAAGSVFATIFGLDVAFCGALGFVGCVAGAVNTPIAATFLAMELFGAQIAPFAGTVCVVSYMISGSRSLYPTQILVQPKSDDFVLADPQDKKSWEIKPIETSGKK